MPYLVDTLVPLSLIHIFQLATRVFRTKQAGVQHLGIVEHQQVTCAQQCWQRAENAIHRLRSRGIEQA